MTEPKYSMSVDLSVLESLGINLYSNAAAVLSELVANSYDADSTFISIGWMNTDGASKVVVTDDGCGMDVDALNTRFLTVGYKKRDSEGGASPKWNRPYMGRKGIGKLSVFSIARTVTVYSTRDGESHGLSIKVADLEQAIKDHLPYHPDEVTVPAEYRSQGTTIVLSDLKSQRANLTAAALRKRLARRFDVLDTRSPEEGGFRIELNGNRVTYADRQELKRLEFIWEFGTATLPGHALPTAIRRFTLPNVVDGGQGWKVSGWIGSARKPTDLTSDVDSGSLKNVIVLARGRPIQEGIIEKLDFSRIFGNYVTGQVQADFLDLDDGYEDIATSDRQRLIEDDVRVVGLQAFLRDAFVKASETWSEERPRKKAIDALAQFPKLRQWVEGLPQYQRDAARKMIGTVMSLELEKPTAATDRLDLLRSAVLAFERVGLRQVLEDLEKLGDVTSADLLPLLGTQDEYEAGLWVDILRSRIEAISRFRDLTDTNEKEKVLQQHLFDHLWLLDAAWERATGSATMEQNLRRIAAHARVFAVDAEGKEIYGRIDIRYATTGGRHVIVELKRYQVTVDVDVLVEQGLKYYEALASVLSQQNKPTNQIEVVFVLGSHPGTKEKGKYSEEDYRAFALSKINGRYVLYDELITNAQSQYEDYLAASDKAKELDGLLGSFGKSGDELEDSVDSGA